MHSCQPYRFWRDSTDNLPTVPPPRPNALLHRLARGRPGWPSARARGRGRSRAPGGSVEPRLYFPRGAATACVIIELWHSAEINNHNATISINYNHVIL